MAARLIAVALRIASAGAAATVLVSSAWLMARPQSDQPLLDAFAYVTGLGPAYFLSPTERATYEGAVADTRRFTEEAERLGVRASEHAVRQGAPPGDDELERIVAYQHSFEEMAQGERFVERILRNRAREKVRFVIGVPAAVLSLICLALLGYVPRQRLLIRGAVAAARSVPPG
jgi:zinc/manganese transport system permease protein